jgi:hypothetical protein
VIAPCDLVGISRFKKVVVSKSRVVWECSSKLGGKLHLRLNIGERPIANKYREGKMK